MSKIQEQISRVNRTGWSISADQIVEYSSVKDIKEYIEYLQNEIESKDMTIKELIIENVKLEVKGGNNNG